MCNRNKVRVIEMKRKIRGRMHSTGLHHKCLDFLTMKEEIIQVERNAVITSVVGLKSSLSCLSMHVFITPLLITRHKSTK